MAKCRDCYNETSTNFANLCNSCLQNPNSRTSQFTESNKEQDDNLNQVKQRYQCGICNEHASHAFGNNFRILQRNNPLFELLRCEACGYTCGTCSANADPELSRNKQVFIRDFNWRYLHCGHCNHEIQLACTRCNNNHLFSLNKLMQNDFPPTRLAECVNCANILKWENNLSRTSTILSKYNPDNKFTTKIPMVVEYMKEDIGFIDNWSKRRDIWLNEEYQRTIVKSNSIKTTIKIPQYEAKYKKYNKYDKVKSMYYRCWQSYLADYEKYLKKKYYLVRIEIDTWKISSPNSRYPSKFNYPIIIHYHLLPKNWQN